MFVEICHQIKIFFEILLFPASAVVFYQRKAILLILWESIDVIPSFPLQSEKIRRRDRQA